MNYEIRLKTDTSGYELRITLKKEQCTNCVMCGQKEETITYIFFECMVVVKVWKKKKTIKFGR